MLRRIQYRSNPFYLLNEREYTYNSDPKQFIYETVERNFTLKFQERIPHILCLKL